jgi:hypothetical protein
MEVPINRGGKYPLRASTEVALTEPTYWEGTKVPQTNQGPLVFEDSPRKTPVSFQAMFQAFFGVRRVEAIPHQSISPQEDC